MEIFFTVKECSSFVIKWNLGCRFFFDLSTDKKETTTFKFSRFFWQTGKKYSDLERWNKTSPLLSKVKLNKGENCDWSW